MQYHYVGLDKIPEPALPVADKPVLSDQPNQPKQPDQPDSEPASDNELDDATIAEGDEHRVQISGAPQASMMCVEILKALDILCVLHQLKERNH